MEFPIAMKACTLLKICCVYETKSIAAFAEPEGLSSFLSLFFRYKIVELFFYLAMGFSPALVVTSMVRNECLLEIRFFL